MLECSNIVAAIFFCVGAHYIFNLNYHRKSGELVIMTFYVMTSYQLTKFCR